MTTLRPDPDADRPSRAHPDRRSPQQDRSRETVERILLAADAEIGELGLGGASTTGIAKRAGVSVGALYRFFADKEAIADALARAYLDDVTLVYAEVLAGIASRTEIGSIARELVDRAARLQLSHPGYYRLTEDLPPELDDSPAHQVREQLVDTFVAALRGMGVEEDGVSLRPVVALAIETVRHTLVQAPVEEPGRGAVLAELRTMVTAYLETRLG